MRRTSRAVASLCALALVSFGPVAASAQPAGPDDGGYVGKGNLVVQTLLAGAKITVGGNIALEERGSRLRIDVLSLAIPGADPTISAVLGTQLFPPGGFTVVYDRRDATYVVWSNARRAFFAGGGHANDGGDQRVPSYAGPAAGAIASGSDLFSAFSALRSLKDDKTFAASVSLTGHTTLFGHPVSTLHYEFVQTPLAGNAAMSAHGELELADDLDSIPVRITASVSSKSIPQSSLRLDLVQLAKRSPPDEDFVPPPDFARANGLGDVIGGKLSF